MLSLCYLFLVAIDERVSARDSPSLLEEPGNSRDLRRRETRVGWSRLFSEISLTYISF